MPEASPLACASATQEVLERHGLSAKYALGQNFLVNDHVVRRILELSAVGPGQEVLEVGPGIGTLTWALLSAGARVVAIEKDPDLPAVLADTLAAHQGSWTVLNEDALGLDAARLKAAGFAPAKLVSNLPYAVAATVILDCFERIPTVGSATVMVQREVADRICAKPGTKAYGAYTVKLSLYAQVAGRFDVGPASFLPPPRVTSTVVRLDRVQLQDSQGAPVGQEVVRAACAMADAAFANRRKTLANSCRAYFAARGPEGCAVAELLPCVLERAGIDPSRRGETLSRQEFVALGQALHQAL